MKYEHRIIELAMEGTRPAAIASTLRCRPAHVYQVIRTARNNGADIPHFRKRTSLAAASQTPVVPQRIVVSVPLYSLLQKEALRRDRTVNEVAEALLGNGLLGTVARHE